MKIVLLGYMGSGKSTIGKLLSKERGLEFIDLDNYIEEAEQMSVPDIFKTKGELYFRKKEYAYLNEVLAQMDNFVLSLGGGTPCYGNNMQAVLDATKNAIYLKVSIAELVNRLLKEKDQRPLIMNIPEDELPEFIGKHLFERSYFYNQTDKVISSDGKNPEEIVAEMGALLV
ncbi:shikimate kinase [Zobellia sp. 1_MG-2023]|uniref:shikimate kinase n=1 Tax=Zobellia sp. 1_MG-2023 TaxID=3062626 RepID=UPI0026E1DC51|nr:shikimate kinase [Zobellia sp. 1_MG-2023]MDO6821003.1 shikimate kinase [Zobellia sp. 1_MG-2023]